LYVGNDFSTERTVIKMDKPIYRFLFCFDLFLRDVSQWLEW